MGPAKYFTTTDTVACLQKLSVENPDDPESRSLPPSIPHDAGGGEGSTNATVPEPFSIPATPSGPSDESSAVSTDACPGPSHCSGSSHGK